MMKVQKKSWAWKLTWPFAHKNLTCIWNTVYAPGWKITEKQDNHEKKHSLQQHGWTWFGFPFWLYLYLGVRYSPVLILIVGINRSWFEALMLSPTLLLGVPLFFSPFRYRWEYDAYRNGSEYTHEQTTKILGSMAYGWMPWAINGWAVKR